MKTDDDFLFLYWTCFGKTFKHLPHLTRWSKSDEVGNSRVQEESVLQGTATALRASRFYKL